MEDILEIRTIEDLERILRERSDWKERIRQLILTEELINLPSKFDRFVEHDFKPLKNKVDNISKDVDILKQDVGILKEDATVLKQDVAILKQDVKKLKDDVGDLKGKFMELQVRDKIGAFLGHILKKAKLIDFSELADTLYEASNKGLISEEEVRDALKIDAVAEGYMRKNDGKRILIALEVSYVADKNDLERAFRKAETIFKAYGIECIPAVIGEEFTEGANLYAEEMGVLLISRLRRLYTYIMNPNLINSITYDILNPKFPL